MYLYASFPPSVLEHGPARCYSLGKRYIVRETSLLCNASPLQSRQPSNYKPSLTVIKSVLYSSMAPLRQSVGPAISPSQSPSTSAKASECHRQIVQSCCPYILEFDEVRTSESRLLNTKSQSTKNDIHSYDGFAMNIAV